MRGTIDMPEQLPELLDRHQAAEMLNISVRLLHHKSKHGQVPGFLRLFGTSARWSRSALQRWIDDGCPVGPFPEKAHQSADRA